MGQHLMLQYPLGMGKIHLVSSICSRRRAEDCTRNLPSMLHTLYRMTVLFHLRIYLATHAKQIHFIYVNNVPGICIKKNWVIPQMIKLIIYNFLDQNKRDPLLPYPLISYLQYSAMKKIDNY